MSKQHTPKVPERSITPSYPNPDMHFDYQWKIPLRFLWFCAGANREYLEKPECAVERNKYAGVGFSVLCTATFALFAGGYAFFFVFHSLIASAIAGLFWGVVIFGMDRFIVQSMWKSRERKMPWPLIALRVVLAVLIATVVSTPLELRIFKPEIDSQLSKDVVAARLTDPTVASLRAQLAKLQGENDSKAQKVEEAFNETKAEAKGQGASGEVGKGNVYGDAKTYWKDAKDLYQKTFERNEPEVKSLLSRIEARENELNTNAVIDPGQSTDGLLKRLNALSELQDDQKTGRVARTTIWVVFFLLLVIETMPLLSKSLIESGPYSATQEAAAAVGIARVQKDRETQMAYLDEWAIHKLSNMRQAENAKSEFFENALTLLRESHEYRALSSDMASAFIEQIRREFGLLPQFDSRAIYDRLNNFRRSGALGRGSSDDAVADNMDSEDVLQPNLSRSRTSRMPRS